WRLGADESVQREHHRGHSADVSKAPPEAGHAADAFLRHEPRPEAVGAPRPQLEADVRDDEDQDRGSRPSRLDERERRGGNHAGRTEGEEEALPVPAPVRDSSDEWRQQRHGYGGEADPRGPQPREILPRTSHRPDEIRSVDERDD